MKLFGNLRLALLFGGSLTVLSACAGGTEPAAPPAALASVSATAASHTEVQLNWAPAGAAVSELQVERAIGSGAFLSVASLAGSATSYRDVGLTPGTTYRYRIRACGDGGCSDFTTATVTTNAELLIATTTLPEAVRGEQYSSTLDAIGGAGGFVWSVSSGSLPTGLTLSEQGLISGIPGTLQTSVFMVRVRSSDGQTATRELTLRVLDAAPGGVAIVTSALAPALVGASYTVTLAASGGDGTYAWSVASGSLPAGLTLSAGGTISGTPTTAGSSTFTVRATSAGRSTQRSYTIVVAPDDRTRFNLSTFEVAQVPDAIRPALTSAVARGERVITADLSSAQIPQRFFSGSSCGGFGAMVNGTSVDDVIVIVNFAPIDGPSRVVGQAGPCGLRNDRLPFVGILTIDTDDLNPLAGTQTLTDVIFHEIGHVLGFGTTWNSAVLSGSGTSDPRFTGAAAVQEYAVLGGTGSVPVENTGGTGTANAHWREASFRTEILTGFAERVGVAMPLSRMSIASMADLGYVVSYVAADAFALPSALAAPPVTLEPPRYDVILDEPVRILPVLEPRP